MSNTLLPHYPKNIPLDEIYVPCLGELPQSDQIVVYTRQEGDSRVRMAINQLSVSGYRRVGILRRGLSEWQRGGLSLVGGRQSQVIAGWLAREL